MSNNFIPYKETGYFSKLICDYLEEKKILHPFYNRFPALENFKKQIEEKSQNYPSEIRGILSERIKIQYGTIPLSEATSRNIELLKNKGTFTITTGHQLNLFSGPLYFFYKIFSVINLCEKLKTGYPGFDFVPVFWMATEDHDFEEINHFHFHNKKISWNREAAGAVGELSTEGLDRIYEDLKTRFRKGENTAWLLKLFSDAYLQHKNLADATRFLVNSLFSEYGLVILDGNDPELKKLFSPFAKKELLEKTGFRTISETTSKLVDAGYQEQVFPREINLFYLKKNLRERLLEKDGIFYVNQTGISFSEEELIAELKEHPERFSPNALLRPLYQEIILPNLCYIGGGGELAYWFQLKDFFEEMKITFPVLLLRNSALLIAGKTFSKLEKLNLSLPKIFLPQQQLINQYTCRISDIEIDFTPQKNFLQKQFEDLYRLAEKTDKSFLGAVAAQEKKQLNGLENLEKRLLRAQRRKLSDQLKRVTDLQDLLFPHQSLQERYSNFSEFYSQCGPGFFSQIKESLNPLQPDFTTIILKDSAFESLDK